MKKTLKLKIKKKKKKKKICMLSAKFTYQDFPKLMLVKVYKIEI